MRQADTVDNDLEDTKIYIGLKFAIGERAFLLQTHAGNILWDMITLLDDDTIDFVRIFFPLPNCQDSVLNTFR